MLSPSAAQQPVSSSSSHPKGLYVLFATEMWERFSYYGMRALLILYMTKALVFDKEYASLIYGNFTSLVYLTPLLGGYVADRYWGNRRSILVGGLMMAMGQFALFFSASMYVSGQASAPQTQLALFMLGLGLLIFGNGFFKPNISSMVGSLYPAGDSRIDTAYTIFYMGINLGAFFSPLVCGTLGDTGNPEDFKWGFLAAGIGMLVGTLTFELFKNKYIVSAEGQALGARPEQAVAHSPVVPMNTDAPVRAETIDQPAAKSFASKLPMLIGLFVVVYGAIAWLMNYDWVGAFVFAAMIVTPVAVLADASITSRERQKIYVILILSFFVIFFWGAFEQAGASLTYFADEQTQRNVGEFPVWLKGIIITVHDWFYAPNPNLEMPASYFQSANALFIILFAPVFAVVWTFMGKRGIEPSSPLKMSIGLMFLAIGYLIIAFGVKGVDASTKVSMFWLITMYLMHTFGELCLSPIGLALVNKLAPLRFASLLMAVWFLATAAGNKFAGVLSALYPEPGKPSPFFVGFEITGLYEFFMIFVALSAAASLVLFVIYRKLTQMMAEPVTH